MKVVVRDYQSDDWLPVEQMILNAENFGAAFLEHEKRKVAAFTSFPQLGKVIVAENSGNGGVLGYAVLQFEWKALVITSIISHHNHLRHGIGRKLVDRIKEIGETHPDTDVIRVDTGDFMDYAHRFYLSCGFTKVGCVQHYLSWHNHQVFFAYQLKKMETK